MNCKPPSKSNTKPAILKIEEVATTPYLRLQKITYRDQNNKVRPWNLVERSNKSSMDQPDAVVIITIIKGKTCLDTLLVEQFRPPIQGVGIEFPAGLVDKGETPEQAALRELKEETGYVGTVEKSFKTPLLCMSPGLTNEMIMIVVVNVNPDDPTNKNPKPKFDDGEFVTTRRVPLLQTLKNLQNNNVDKGMPISLLYSFALGVEIGMMYGKK